MRSGSVGMKLMCSPVGGIDGSCNADVKLLCPFHKLKQGGITREWMKVTRGASGDGMCKMVREEVGGFVFALLSNPCSITHQHHLSPCSSVPPLNGCMDERAGLPCTGGYW